MAESPYLLTSVEGLPIIVKCNHTGEKLQYKKKGSVTLGLDVFKQAIQSGAWTQETDQQFVADTINKFFSEHEVWVRRSDAFHTPL
jgi:hypothetical protein